MLSPFFFFQMKKLRLQAVEWFLENIRSRIQIEMGLILQIKCFPMTYTCFFPLHNCGCHLKALGPITSDHCVLSRVNNPFQAYRSWEDMEKMREHGVESCSLVTSLRPVCSVTNWRVKRYDVFIFLEQVSLISLPCLWGDFIFLNWVQNATLMWDGQGNWWII